MEFATFAMEIAIFTMKYSCRSRSRENSLLIGVGIKKKATIRSLSNVETSYKSILGLGVGTFLFFTLRIVASSVYFHKPISKFIFLEFTCNIF